MLKIGLIIDWWKLRLLLEFTQLCEKFYGCMMKKILCNMVLLALVLIIFEFLMFISERNIFSNIFDRPFHEIYHTLPIKNFKQHYNVETTPPNKLAISDPIRLPTTLRINSLLYCLDVLLRTAICLKITGPFRIN